MCFRAGICGLLLLGAMASVAAALGFETVGNAELASPNYPPKLVPVVNRANRVYHRDVNGSELFCYQGDATSLSAFLADFAAAEAADHHVLIRPGSGKTTTFDGKKEIPFNWQMETVGQLMRQMLLREDQGEQIWHDAPKVTIYLGAYKLDELKFPENVQLVTLDQEKARVAKAIESSASTHVRGWGCGALAHLDRFDSESLATIARQLDDDDDWVKLNAIGALAVYGSRAAEYAPKLRALAETTGDKGLKDTIAKTLATIGQSPAEDEAAILQHNLQLRRIEEFVKQR